MLVTRDGKGRKRRIVLFSFERRKVLFRYVSDYKRKADLLLLARRNETLSGRRVMVRDMKRLCKRLGFDPPVADPAHFQTFFCRELPSLRRECVPLQKVLGHSSLEMTRKNANLLTEDLQAVHERITLRQKAA